MFQAHIVEQHKSYRMVVESWELVRANLNVPLFVQGTFVSACRWPAQRAIASDLMNVLGLHSLNHWTAEELVYLLVFVWSPRSERLPRPVARL